ncbi:MAG: GerMN domain-containing protein [Clostridia bacterium]|nr:GerMN domain-containing protein [Clostridia bacterium]
MMNMRRILSAALAVMLSLSLSACSAKKTPRIASNGEEKITLPIREANAPPAPYGDKKDSEVYRASIYYASADGSVSVPSTRVLWLNSQSSVERRIAEELMKVPGGDALAVVPRGSRIASVEAAGEIVSVNVLPTAVMSDMEVKTLAEAMSRTLFELSGVEYVNLFLYGRAASFNGLPVGLIGKTTDVSALLDESIHFAETENASVSRRAAVYFPSVDETCVIPMETTLSYAPDDPAEAVLRALGNEPHARGVLSGVPACENMFERKSHYEVMPSGDRILNIHLTNDAFDALEASGHDRHMYLASIVLSLTSFLSDTDGVLITIGGKTITEVPLSGGTMRAFSAGIMKRDDFAAYIGENVPLYFSGEDDMLHREFRALPISASDSARARILSLMSGPMDDENRAVFPDGVRASDILGVQISGSVLSVNLSSNVYRLAQGFTQSEEELFVYGLVNTLSDLRGVSGVRLYFEGATGSVLTQKVYLEGVILKNPGRVYQIVNSASN